jgi:hypothetical protein
MGRNQLAGILPPELGNMSSLRKFRFMQSRIFVCLHCAACFGLGPVLVTMLRSHLFLLNQIANSQRYIFTVEIRLYENQLAGPIPPELFNSSVGKFWFQSVITVYLYSLSL